MTTLLEFGVLLELLRLRMAQADEVIELSFNNLDVVLICHLLRLRIDGFIVL